MERLDLGRWIPAILGVAAGTVAIVVNYAQGNIVFATVLVVVFALIAWWSWPGRNGAHVSHVDAQANTGDDDVIVYWRPG